MPSVRFTFSCDIDDDWDVIDWIKSFAVRERGMAIKAAIRQFQEETEPEELSDNRLSEIEKSIKEILNEVVSIRRKGLIVQSEKKKESNNNKEYDLTQVENNLKNFT